MQHPTSASAYNPTNTRHAVHDIHTYTRLYAISTYAYALQYAPCTPVRHALLTALTNTIQAKETYFYGKRDLLIWQKRPAYCTQTHHTRCSIRHALFFCFLLRTHTVYNSSIHLFTTHTFYYTYLLLHVPYTIAPYTSPTCCVHVPYTICFKHRTFPFCIHIRHTTPYIP